MEVEETAITQTENSAFVIKNVVYAETSNCKWTKLCSCTVRMF